MGAGPGQGRRWWMRVAVTGVILIAAAFWAGTRVTSPAVLASGTRAASRTVLTASVVWRRLSETLTVPGKVEPAGSFDVYFGPVTVAGAQPIVTATPRRAGSVVTNGAVLAEIAGRPVFALRGATPMYRDLTVGDQGRDVLQLQEGLAAAGFGSGDAPGVFGAGTESAVRGFYHAAGYAPPGSATAARSRAASGGRAAIVVPQAEVVFVPALPAVVESTSLGLGRPVTDPAVVLGTGRLGAVLPLTTAQSALVSAGDGVTLYVSGMGGQLAVFAARVTRVRPAPAAQGGAGGTGSGGGPALEALITSRARLNLALVGAVVTGRIIVSATSGPVLAVPAAALYSSPDGQAIVTVITRGGRVAVPVRTGTMIGGYVPVQALRGQLTAGQQVLVGE